MWVWNTTMTRTSVMSRRHLAEVGVKIHHAVTEPLHVLRQELVCIGYPIIQVSHFVVGESPEGGTVVLGDRKTELLEDDSKNGSLQSEGCSCSLTAGTRRTASLWASHETGALAHSDPTSRSCSPRRSGTSQWKNKVNCLVFILFKQQKFDQSNLCTLFFNVALKILHLFNEAAKLNSFSKNSLKSQIMKTH